MKNTHRNTLQVRWNTVAALALLCLTTIGITRQSFAADAAITASTVEVVPYQAGGYRYSVINYATQTTRPHIGFEQPGFNDSQWSSGGASMGSGGYCGLQSTRQSNWPVGTEIYVRRKVIIPAGATNIRIMAAADNDILAFFDGVPLGPTITHEDCPVLDEFRLNVEPYAGTVTAGEHTLAFYIKDRGNQSFFDMRLLVDVVPVVTLSSDRSAVCAGGWSADHGYQYLPKDPDGTLHPYAARIKPDPHIATLTATVKNKLGNPIVGKTVAFEWDMPGDAPSETPTVITDANGKASIDVISGDELSKDTDEDTGTSLLDIPIPVTATCLGIKAEKKLDVVAPVVQWQYKNEAGNYVEWDGETSEMNSDPAHPDEVLLRCLLTHDNLAVTGHPISWGFEKVLDKAGAEVPTNDPDYLTYGHMSGGISTTTLDGGATAIYTLGYNFGQIIFRIDDENINTLDLTPAPPLVARTLESIKIVAHAQFRQIADVSIKPKKKKRTKKTALAHDYYKWVDGPAGFGTKRGYPAPSGEEGQELLPETRSFVGTTLLARTTPYRTNPRLPYTEWISGIRDPRNHRVPMQFGQWWYAQVIGDDATSATYHFADMKQMKNNKLYLYGAAFDIVLTNVPILQNSGKREEFETYVFDLRHAGIVAWHRWADEPGSEENEMHCIDAAVPFIKPPLSNGFWTNSSGTRRKGQILAFLDGETGGGSYLVDWAITEHQKLAVRNRATTQRDDMKAKPAYDNASAVNWPNRQ